MAMIHGIMEEHPVSELSADVEGGGGMFMLHGSMD
jgi:hypothetical protein